MSFLCLWPEALTRPPNLLQNYLPSQEGMAYNQFVKMMIIFSIAFITVLILKVSGAWCVAAGGRRAVWPTPAMRGECLPLPPPALGSLLQPSPLQLR